MLELKNLKASIGEKSIIKGLNLNIKPGEVHAIMGPNGSGKSTLANVLSGKNGYDISGSLIFDGQDLQEIPIEERNANEVNFVQGKDKDSNIINVDIAPEGTKSRNPAFDVTPSRLVSGLITEYGVFNADYNSLQKLKIKSKGQ